MALFLTPTRLLWCALEVPLPLLPTLFKSVGDLVVLGKLMSPPAFRRSTWKRESIDIKLWKSRKYDLCEKQNELLREATNCWHLTRRGWEEFRSVKLSQINNAFKVCFDLELWESEYQSINYIRHNWLSSKFVNRELIVKVIEKTILANQLSHKLNRRWYCAKTQQRFYMIMFLGAARILSSRWCPKPEISYRLNIPIKLCALCHQKSLSLKWPHK